MCLFIGLFEKFIPLVWYVGGWEQIFPGDSPPDLSQNSNRSTVTIFVLNKTKPYLNKGLVNKHNQTNK